MKDFVPKFLLDSVDEALETTGLSDELQQNTAGKYPNKPFTRKVVDSTSTRC